MLVTQAELVELLWEMVGAMVVLAVAAMVLHHSPAVVVVQEATQAMAETAATVLIILQAVEDLAAVAVAVAVADRLVPVVLVAAWVYWGKALVVPKVLLPQQTDVADLVAQVVGMLLLPALIPQQSACMAQASTNRYRAYTAVADQDLKTQLY